MRARTGNKEIWSVTGADARGDTMEQRKRTAAIKAADDRQLGY